jgi:hypothetical protein
VQVAGIDVVDREVICKAGDLLATRGFDIDTE